MAQSAPTKGNLNAAKRSRALADNGYELMDRKRNILIREIMDLIDEAESLQQRIDSTFSEAYASMRLAEISMGGSAESGANVVPIDDSFSIRFRSVMGVELPVVNAEPEEPSGPPYGLAFIFFHLIGRIHSICCNSRTHNIHIGFFQINDAGTVGTMIIAA